MAGRSLHCHGVPARPFAGVHSQEREDDAIGEAVGYHGASLPWLDYAHARGVVHRDIKPANVMVTTDGVAKVVDFGIARLADQKLTQVGQVLGTVSYMSPEQLQGKALDGRSDIFAVGVMLFEALTSVLPFAAENTGQR